MTTENDARVWLRANGHADVADQIDAIMDGRRERGVKTRRNWWDVLAGNREGNPRKVEGVTFPVLAAARRRKGWPPCDSEIGAGEAAPAPKANRWRDSKSKGEPRTAGTQTKGRTRRKTGDGGTMNGERAHGASSGSRGPLPMLTVKNFAQLEEVVLPLADLVVMVGPQATGKSLVLELLKLAIDRNRIVRVLKQHGFTWERPEEFAALYLGGRLREELDRPDTGPLRRRGSHAPRGREIAHVQGRGCRVLHPGASHARDRGGLAAVAHAVPGRYALRGASV